MSRFDSTEGARISKQIEETIQRQRIGRVVEVFQHLTDDDKSNFEVDVELLDTRDGQLRAIPWQSPHVGEIKVPMVGDHVIIEFQGKSRAKPVARNLIYTNNQRPPKGLAGMHRRVIPSDTSPAGDGDLYFESWTQYDQDPASASFEPDNATPQTSFIRLAKKLDDMDEPLAGDTVPILLEMVDDPDGDDSHILLEGNTINSDENKSTDIELDLKGETTTVSSVNDTDNEDMNVELDIGSGVLTVEGIDKAKGRTYQLEIDIRNGNAKLSGDTPSQEMGFQVDFDNGTFKLLDKEGYGIESDGDGNFTWHYKSIDHQQDSTITL